MLKEVDVSEDTISENLRLTSDLSPYTDYKVFSGDIVVEQERADEVYDPDSWQQLESFLEETSEIVEKAVSRGFALDYKPPNFGVYGGEALYIDNQDLGSVRKIGEPALAMSTQLQNYMKNNDCYADRVPDRDEIRSYWEI